MEKIEEIQKNFMLGIECSENFFDLMALCLRYIELASGDEGYIVRGEEVKAFQLLLIEYDDYIGGEYYCEMFEMFKKSIIEIVQQTDDLELLCENIIFFIDDNITPYPYISLWEGESYYKYERLNDLNCDKIIIVPRIKDNLIDYTNRKFIIDGYSLFRDEYPADADSLYDSVKNYIVLNSGIIDAYDLEFFNFDSNQFPYSEIIQKKKLSFAINPVTCEDIKEFYKIKYTDRKNYKYFELTGLQKLKQLNKNMGMQALKHINNEHILCFPEMFCGKEMTEIINEQITNVDSFNALTFCGSTWEKQKNYCPVLDNKGKFIFEYLKKAPYMEVNKGTRYEEHIKSWSKTRVALIDIKGIGRIGVCICKDLCDDKIKSIHRLLRTNILIVPAFSKSNDLMPSAENLSKENKMIVIVANSCAVSNTREETKDIGFISVPAKNKTKRWFVMHKYNNKSCRQKCKESYCPGYVYTVNFNKLYEKGEIKSISVI